MTLDVDIVELRYLAKHWGRRAFDRAALHRIGLRSPAEVFRLRRTVTAALYNATPFERKAILEGMRVGTRLAREFKREFCS